MAKSPKPGASAQKKPLRLSKITVRELSPGKGAEVKGGVLAKTKSHKIPC